MSQAEDLLNSVSEEIPVHSHPVPDTDAYFIIDPISRKIENPNRKKNVVMQYDHNSERCTFELPRYIDGHDMLECTSVTVNVDNIEVVEFEEGEEIESRVNSDAPDITDLRLHPSDHEKAICSWLISRNSTQLAGILSFHIEFKCVDSNGNVVYEWSTDDYEGIEVRARKKNGEAAIAEYTDLLEQWRTSIFGAGDSVMADIAAEGEAQVAAVKAESETQQEAVELKGAQTLDSIPEDYTEVDAMADEAVRTKGDAIVCEAAGESIVLKDSSDDHIRGLKLFGKSSQVTTTGKNLFGGDTLANKLVEIASNPTKNTANKTVSFNASNGVAGREIYSGFVTGKQYTIILYGNNSGPSSKHPNIRVVYTDGSNSTPYFKTAGIDSYACLVTTEGKTVSKVELIEYGYVTTLYYDKCGIFDGVLTEADYEPYTGGKPSPNPEYPQNIVSVENPTVSSYGKNLLNCSDISLTDFTNHYYTIYTDFQPIIGETYALSMNVNTDVLPFAINIGCGSTKYDADMSPKISASYTENGRIVISFKWVPTQEQVESGYTKLFIRVPRYASKTTFNATVTNIQLELGSEVTEYEPYKPVQSVAIPHTLPGIPVTSGGNYTDPDGQQWICDEIDLERGVYVQRIKTQTCTGADTEMWDYITSNGVQTTGVFRLSISDIRSNRESTGRATLCDSYKHATNLPIPNHEYWGNSTYFGLKQVAFRNDAYTDVDSWKTYLTSNPIEVLYQLATPVEMPLTAEEIAAFKALHTNYPNTTILNDAGAWMSVKYNADTKSYVENPRVLKLTDSSTGVVYELKIVDGNITINPV